MQFTSSLVSLLLAAVTTGVQAIPGSPVEQRQEAPRIYAKFWNDTACGADGGAWVEDTVWLQEPLDGSCIDVEVWTTFASTEIVFNSATHDLRAYSLDKCDESGNHYDVPAGKTGCWAQFVDSVKYL
ncbi:hypothetical protein N8I77_003012 [Diaporthe amygdali]|uniref:Uncharacterized protein n=1 Tax=Phomopsis amygdali TaxID=1214568 RepID=A0AAD9SJ31_PHOAM|nr:uncharacterized protein J7T55_009863 [Diaporthe amygdali]KAJ0116713.1 hypothetical protein J7T55_009863 [Diaporthe amygdali]KAK2609515.1 hypothetical protein N8I77_003012 [Diaporthe amygdali]